MDAFGDAWAFLTEAGNWSGSRGILARLQAHVWISFVATLIAFFLAEMGDKTQVATVMLAAQYPDFILVIVGTTLGSAVGWWAGAHVGMMTAFMLSIVGTGVGLYVARRLVREHF